MDGGIEFFNSAISKYKTNLELRDNGKRIGIPYPFKSLDNSLYGIQKGQFIGLTSGPKSSKSKITRFIFIYSAIKFAKVYNYNLKIIYFPLEDSPQQIMDNMISHYLFDLYKIRISSAELSSKGEKPVSKDILNKINESEEFFKDIFNYLYIIPDVSNPHGILKVCEIFAEKNGTVFKKKVEGFDNEVLVDYIPHNDLHTIVIIDNLSNVSKEKWHKEEWDAMGDLTRNILRKKICKIFNFTAVLVQQQALNSESVQFTNTGRNIVEKLEPSISNLGDYKGSSRDKRDNS
jgi:DnaB-like helicase C terminal domain